MLETLPELSSLLIAPLSAAFVGFFNLAVRQGWGFIVAFANGIWAGVLSIFVSGTLFMTLKIIEGLQANEIRDFDQFLQKFSSEIEPMAAELSNIPLVIVSLGACAVAGVVTEVIHWVLVRFKQGRGGTSSSH